MVAFISNWTLDLIASVVVLKLAGRFTAWSWITSVTVYQLHSASIWFYWIQALDKTVMPACCTEIRDTQMCRLELVGFQGLSPQFCAQRAPSQEGFISSLHRGLLWVTTPHPLSNCPFFSFPFSSPSAFNHTSLQHQSERVWLFYKRWKAVED